MSLRVWLPLNGSLENRGLDNITVVNSGATIDNSGKIGKCYNFDGSNDYISLTGSTLYNTIKGGTLPFSVAFWVYHADNTRAIIFGDYSLSGAIGFNIELTTDHTVRFYWNGSPDLNIAQMNVGSSTWTHVALVYDATYLYGYINGSLVYTYTNSLSSKTKTYGSYYLGSDARTGATVLNGKLNDFRLYDHALSPQEIKKISQGMIVHYPLNRNGWGQDNLLTNTHFDTRYSQTTGWNTTKNGTQLASSWGGYNGGVTNAGSVYHAHLKEVNDEYVYEFIKTADESWLGISQGGLNTKLTAGDTYTFSWEEYHVDGINRVGTGLYYYKEGATSANFHLGIQQALNVTREIGRWQKFSYTFVAPSDADYTKSISWYIYGHYNGNGTFYVRHPKLEKNSSPTAWCPNVSDDLYSNLNVNNNTMYDISGFGNNGTIHGTFSYQTDTPLYKMSTSAQGSGTNYLEGIVLPAEAKTVSLWIKPTSRSSSMAVFSDKTSTLAIAISSASVIYTNATASTKGFTMTHWVDDDWNHVVVVNDGGTRRCYINGKTASQGSSSTYFVHNADKFWVWNRSYNNSYPYKGALSDLRIYTTALSADEVKELYEHHNNI